MTKIGMKGRIAALLGFLALAGCIDRDPYMRTDVWRPTGANSANLAAMLANPRDLVRGHGSSQTDTKYSAITVDRVSSDKPRSLNPSSPAGGGGGGDGGGAAVGVGGASAGAADSAPNAPPMGTN